MKTVVKIDPEKEYGSAKDIIESLSSSGEGDLAKLGGSVDNLKTVINVLIERATPKKKKRPPKKARSKRRSKSIKKDFDKLPSERFPDLNVEEKIVKECEAPRCSCCNETMDESGLFKVSEKLEVKPKQYFIVRNKRAVYSCKSCNGSMTNTKSLPSISRTSNYGDSLIIDVALSKYCDLLPIERYSSIAEREGIPGLPANSLINLTHKLAIFLSIIYEKIKAEVLHSRIIRCDETPHKMLEGDETSNWYVWAFASLKGCVLEAHGTRSSDVAINFLANSQADYLVADGYVGYKKALRELAKSGQKITEVFCNAHAYRYFRDASTIWEKDTEVFLQLYGDIYEIERTAKSSDEKTLARQKMKPLFEQIKEKAQKTKENSMPGSLLDKALGYFLNHYDGLAECTNNIDIPLDNNFSERLLRSSVVGRKTWYGTHSKKGANTNVILFSIVETCKINRINPRSYFPWIVENIHKGGEILTPSEYLAYIDSG